MARQIGKLSAISIPRITKQGLHSDGGGLYLRVSSNNGKFWIFRFMLNGKAREMGLGALHSLTLAEARQKAFECRKMLSEGLDPINARYAVQAKTALEAAKSQTFKTCAEAYIDAHRAGWRNPKHIQQWENTLQTYVYPIMGDLPVQDIDVALVMKVFEQKPKAFASEGIFWIARPETASRLRGRIETILDWARARNYRQGENPARWRGHLENLLPKRSRVQRIVHQPALPYEQIGDFMAELKAQEGIASLALAFTILTAARTSETLGATFDEIDFKNKIWTVPAHRIKGGKEHRVPLSEPAMKILRELKDIKDASNKAGWVFMGYKRGKHLSNMSMLMLLKRMNRQDITVHGFRSTFRDWAAEQTNFAREVAESALAHISGDKVELAYRRSDLFEKRRLLMNAWAGYCEMASKKEECSENKVIQLGTAYK